MKEPDPRPLLRNDYSDTLYTYLDEQGRKMDHRSFWTKLVLEWYMMRVVTEKGKLTIKQLEPGFHHRLIGTRFSFDSLDYSLIGKSAADYKGKKVALITLASGCGNCIMLEKDIKILEKEYPDIVFVHLAAYWKGLKSFKEKNNFGDIIILPPGNSNTAFVKSYKAAVPFVYFISEQGEIRAIQGGYGRDFVLKAYREKIQKLQ